MLAFFLRFSIDKKEDSIWDLFQTIFTWLLPSHPYSYHKNVLAYINYFDISE